MSVHVYDVITAGKLDTLNNTKENIKKTFNIQDSGKAKYFLGVYYKWGRDAKLTYAKITI